MKYSTFILVIALSLVPLSFAVAERTTTVAQILLDRDTTTKDVKKPHYCYGGIFKPCVCARDVSKKIMYRPSVRECKGNAAIILTGKYAASYSAVIRDNANADRIPAHELINGCSIYERDTLGLNKCSVYKSQKRILAEDDRGQITVHCLGARGSSAYFNRAQRITVKLSDSPNDTNDPLVRACLYGPTKNLN